MFKYLQTNQATPTKTLNLAATSWVSASKILSSPMTQLIDAYVLITEIEMIWTSAAIKTHFHLTEKFRATLRCHVIASLFCKSEEYSRYKLWRWTRLYKSVSFSHPWQSGKSVIWRTGGLLDGNNALSGAWWHCGRTRLTRILAEKWTHCMCCD